MLGTARMHELILAGQTRDPGPRLPQQPLFTEWLMAATLLDAGTQLADSEGARALPA